MSRWETAILFWIMGVLMGWIVCAVEQLWHLGREERDRRMLQPDHPDND